MSTIVSTDEFWNLMCKAAFIRVSEHKGILYNEAYYCSNPPNLITKMKETNNLLKPKPLHKPLLITLILLVTAYDLHLFGLY